MWCFHSYIYRLSVFMWCFHSYIYRLSVFMWCFHSYIWAPPWSSSSVLDYRSLPPMFKSRRGHIWRLFRLWLCLITFGGRSAHLAYLVHKSGRKTSINHQLIHSYIYQVWDQKHWNVFKYKYFSFGQIQIHWIVNVFKYKYFWMYFKYKYFSNEKNKFIVFPLHFILIHT